MNVLSRFALVGVFATVPLVAAAEEVYFGVNVAQAAYEEDGIDELNPVALSLKAGYGFNRYLSVEGRLGFGVAEDDTTFSGYVDVFGSPVFVTLPVELKVDHFIGLYGKASLPVGDRLGLYALAGMTQGELTVSVPNAGISQSASDSDMSFGLGVDLKLTERATLNAEWAQLIDADGYTLSQLSLGLTFPFGI